MNQPSIWASRDLYAAALRARAYLALDPHDGPAWFNATLALATFVTYDERGGEADPTVSRPARDGMELSELLTDARAWLHTHDRALTTPIDTSNRARDRR